MMKFDSEEKDLLEAFHNDEMIPIDMDGNGLVEAAKNTIEQKRMINFRVNERDFRNIKIKAYEMGVPYQTLLKIIIHQFSEGRLKINL